MSPEDSAAALRTYQREIERLRRELGPSLSRAARGKGREMDFDELNRRMRERLQREGIPE